MPPKPKSCDYRPVTRAYLFADAGVEGRLAAEGESKGDENPKLETEFLCGMDDWENHCDVVLEECENVLLSQLGDNAGLTDDDSDSDPDVAMEEEKKVSSDSAEPELPEPVDLALDNEYFLRSSGEDTKRDPRSYKYKMPVKRYQVTLDVKKYDQEVWANDTLYPKLLKQLRDVDEGREPRSLESMDKQKKAYNSDSDDDDDASSTKAESEAGADLLNFPQPQP